MKINYGTMLNINHFGTASLISLILVAPFIFLELHYNSELSYKWINFPVAMFGILWVLGTVFLIILIPILRTINTRNSLLVHPFSLLVRFIIMALIAWMWGYIVVDQLPCFLGVPNCD